MTAPKQSRINLTTAKGIFDVTEEREFQTFIFKLLFY